MKEKSPSPGGLIPVEDWKKLVKISPKGDCPLPFVQEIFLLECPIAGMSFVEDIDARIAALKPGSEVILQREPQNSHDELAILVLNAQKEKIGYIPRRHNEVISRLLDAGKIMYGKVEEKNEDWDWQHIVIKIFMRDI